MAGEQELASGTVVDDGDGSFDCRRCLGRDRVVTNGVSNAVPYVIPAAIGLGVIFLGYLAAKYLSRVISRPICRRVDETLGKFIGKAIFYAIMMAVVASVASQARHAPLGGIAAVLAGASFAIGLAFQGTLSNFAAGVLMMVFRPFKVGDVINAAGVMGKVNEIDLFTTTLDTPDNRRIIVPNSAISGGTIENVSYHPHRRIEVVVGVDYNADMETTRAALQRAADTLAGQMIHGEGRGAAIVLGNLGDSAVRVESPHVGRFGGLLVDAGIVDRAKSNVNSILVDIGIPYPQLDVHLSRIDEADELSQPRPRIRPAAPRCRPGQRCTKCALCVLAVF